MKKETVSLLLCVALLVSVFAFCGQALAADKTAATQYFDL